MQNPVLAACTWSTELPENCFPKAKYKTVQDDHWEIIETEKAKAILNAEQKTEVDRLTKLREKVWRPNVRGFVQLGNWPTVRPELKLNL